MVGVRGAACRVRGISGEEPYLFDQVMDVVRLDDGRLVVANMGDNTLRYYDASGGYVTRAGGSGEGPEEFLQVMGLERVGDEIWANQFSVRPIKAFDGQGQFIRAITPPIVEGFRGASITAVFDDESLLFGDWPQGMPLQSGLYEGNSTYLHVNLDGTSDTVGVWPAVRFYGVNNRFPYHQPFGPTGSAGTNGTEVVYGNTGDFAFDFFTANGELVRRIRRAWDPLPVTEADKEWFQQVELGLGSPDLQGRMRDQLQSIADAAVYPERHPAWALFRFDRLGNLWVRAVVPGSVQPGSMNPVDLQPILWTIFDTRGVWLGEVTLPANFRVMEIGDDYLAGIRKNDLEVETVVVFGLEKPER